MRVKVLLKFEQEREGLRVAVLSKSREKIKKNYGRSHAKILIRKVL